MFTSLLRVRAASGAAPCAARRLLQTATKTETATAAAAAAAAKASPTGSSGSLSKGDEKLATISSEIPVIPDAEFYPQAPNRATPWSPSQRSRDEVFKNDLRFVGRDLSKQPFAESAMALSEKQPVNYIHGNIAVCNGTDAHQGHPKVYLNLDKDKATSCGYCGAKYAREDLKGKL